ncbi:MAG: keto-deoxy-phosphogluconate aldolase [Acidiphilium sp. 21-68-69]|nr:MAG: keto-deoxy-phosphogluconate aldolase [Acidiphilium sp. 21-68-69]
MNRQDGLDALLAVSPVIPVLTIDSASDAVPLARALIEGGVGVVEVTLRTKAAMAAASRVPFLPGAATPTEVLHLLEAGFRYQKFFPAEQAGGIPMLKAIGAPIHEVTFCPTGGITPASAPDYLALANVICVGGSWLTPADLLRAGDWRAISARAAAAAALRR